MKIQNIDHELIGKYVFFHSKRYLVTGAMSKHKSGRNMMFRLWDPITKIEIWTKGHDTVQPIIPRNSGAEDNEGDISKGRSNHQNAMVAN